MPLEHIAKSSADSTSPSTLITTAAVKYSLDIIKIVMRTVQIMRQEVISNQTLLKWVSAIGGWRPKLHSAHRRKKCVSYWNRGEEGHWDTKGHEGTRGDKDFISYWARPPVGKTFQKTVSLVKISTQAWHKNSRWAKENGRLGIRCKVLNEKTFFAFFLLQNSLWNHSFHSLTLSLQ